MRSKKLMSWYLPLARKGALLGIFFLFGGQAQAQSDVPQGGIKISVSSGLAPTFSWAPDTAIGQLVVEEGDKELWGTETEGTNTYRSPIRYGVHPPDAMEDVPANPLIPGHTYKVSLFRWIRFTEPESLQVVGTQEFTPSPESKEEEVGPVADKPAPEPGEEEKALAQTETPQSGITVSVSGGMAPTFSWTPDSAIGRLVVEEGEKEVWSTETEGTNTYRSPIRYSVHPPDAIEPEPANPLTPGNTYKVSLFRWIDVTTDKFELVGAQAFTPSADTAEEEGPIADIRPTLRAGALTSDFRFEGAMDSQVWWADTDAISNLITIEPEEGGAPEGRTVVKVLASPKEIVVGVRCFDNEPNGIVSFSKARDVAFGEDYQEDHILIVLDTFQDGRSGYVFAVNPTGARSDGLVIEQGEDVNGDWDAIWEAKTSRDDTGWSAEIRIPIKSLSFKKDLTEWGFNVQRRVQRLQETSRWSSAKRDFEIYQTSRAGLLTNLPKFDLGAGLSIRPALVGRARKPEPGATTETDGDLSFDVTQKLGPNLLSALTVNTDFAETEVDVRQINLTRFPVFFPEKRTFFLEGADIFEFGLGLDEDTMLPFFSRRIGLFGRTEDEQAPIPINVGGKINGRVGNTNLGAVIVNTRKVDELEVGDETVEVPQTTMGTIRLKQNVLEESSLGMLATFGDQAGRSKSWMAGADFTYRTSSFLNDKTFLVSLWGLLNNREDLEGDKSAYGLRLDYPNDLFDVNLTTIRIGDGFDPSLGFVPRNNIHLWDFTGDYKPRPGGFIRQMDYEFSFRLFNNHNNKSWESYNLQIKPFDWLLESGDRLQAGILSEGDRPPEEFELAADVNINAGSYEWTRYFMEGRSADKRKISAQVRWETGNYYNGELNTLETRLALKPSSFLTMEFTGQRNTGKAKVLEVLEDGSEVFGELSRAELAETDFTEEVYGFRLLLNFSPNLQLSSLTQYDTQSRELGSNNKLRWTFNPLGDIFVVYNHNLQRTRVNDRWQWDFVSNELPVKIQYAWRF